MITSLIATIAVLISVLALRNSNQPKAVEIRYVRVQGLPELPEFLKQQAPTLPRFIRQPGGHYDN